MKTSKADYVSQFAGGTDGAKQREALKTALDIRKFEIDTYWKRGTYFWALIATAFAAFFVLDTGKNTVDAFLASCLGTLFSVGWYLANRGSGAWQRNWEAQVDLLEDEIMGPLHKSVINHRVHKFFDLAGPFGYSPSRLNTILSLVVVATWAALLARTLLKAITISSDRPFVVIVSLILMVALFGLLRWGRSDPSDEARAIDVRVRSYL